METKFGVMDANGNVTIDAQIDLNKVPSSDPIAFTYGMVSGKRRRGESRGFKHHGSPHRDLAPEYLRGFLLGYTGILVPEGTKIKKGQEQCFALLHLNVLKKQGG